MELSYPVLDMMGKAVMYKKSPTDELLGRMESRRYSVLTLFTWLYHMKHFQAMDIIKAFGLSIIHLHLYIRFQKPGTTKYNFFDLQWIRNSVT